MICYCCISKSILQSPVNITTVLYVLPHYSDVIISAIVLRASPCKFERWCVGSRCHHYLMTCVIRLSSPLNHLATHGVRIMKSAANVTLSCHFPRYWPFVRGPTGHRWIPLTGASDAELWCFLWSAPQLKVKKTMEALVIWDVIALIRTPLLWFWWNWFPHACMNSLPSNGANCIRHQWFRRWLLAFGPKPLPEPSGALRLLAFINFAMHGTPDNHPIALPF